MPFYKKLAGEIHTAAAVYASGYSLTEDDHESRDYPIDGWYWAETQDDALALLPDDASDTQASLKQWWADLTEDEQCLIYKHAPESLLAWERGEMNIMAAFIVANDAPELVELKAEVVALMA